MSSALRMPLDGHGTRGGIRRRLPAVVGGIILGSGLLLAASPALATSAGTNVRVTVDQGGSYMSADQLAGGTYTDAVLQRCGIDRRMQNEPTLAIDPRNPSIWASGANDYCTIPTVRDAWAGFYRSTDGGSTWTDSLLPGYKDDTSGQGLASPLHAMVAAGALAAGDPVMSWDGEGRLFYMGNNFSRGIENGVSARFRNNTGDVWVATYEPSDPTNNATDGARYVQTVLLATNTFGQGSFNDKTNLAVDPVSGNVYAAWSAFHGSGCNEIDFARSTDHGATFSAPMKISSGICGNQGPSIAVGKHGNVYIGWEAFGGGSFGQGPKGATGIAFASSSNFGRTFSGARVVQVFDAFTSGQFSNNGSRDCGDGPFACPTGFTFPRFDLAAPFLAFDRSSGNVVAAFQAMQSGGQGQIEVMRSSDGGATWSAPVLLSASDTGHQFFPFLAASGGRISAIWYDSRGDAAYAATRPPCNDVNGATYPCLNVMYASSTDGTHWSPAIQVTGAPTNPNYEQFGGRRIPFIGDYITVAAQGDTIGAVWTDQRNTVGASDTTGDNDGADVAGDPETGGACTSAFTACFDGTGGLDQNIYSATITP